MKTVLNEQQRIEATLGKLKETAVGYPKSAAPKKAAPKMARNGVNRKGIYTKEAEEARAKLVTEAEKLWEEDIKYSGIGRVGSVKTDAYGVKWLLIGSIDIMIKNLQDAKRKIEAINVPE